ncbi:MAG: O-methyltransferase [Silvibacterium sp.]|nr:O-methyltransferase [Silvibacterium sp.]
MSQELWTSVDRYLAGLLLPADPALDAALNASTAAGLPEIAVSPTQGKLLMMLAQIVGARSILEMGTLGGYSTLWLARGLPINGKLITLEFDPKHAAVATANIARAGFAGIVEIRVGKALETLPEIAAEGHGPFDFIFIDADKGNYPGYLEWAIKLSRQGTLIVVDNVVREGAVIDASSNDLAVLGVRRMNEMMGGDRRLTATAIQTVGSKGYDGFMIAVVRSED